MKDELVEGPPGTFQEKGSGGPDRHIVDADGNLKIGNQRDGFDAAERITNLPGKKK